MSGPFVILVDPWDGIVLDMGHVSRREDAKRIDSRLKQRKEETKRTPDRVICLDGITRVMAAGEEIPIPK
jgi:hypothetical protein